MTGLRRFLAVFAAFAALAAFALAQDERDLARDKDIAAATQSLAGLSAAFDREEIDDDARFAAQVRAGVEASRALLPSAETALRRAEESLALLGPAPKEGEPAEAASLAEDRKTLTERVAYLQSQRTRILANLDEGARLLAALSQQRLEARWRRILRRDAPLFSPSLWTRAADESAALAAKTSAYFARWRDAREGSGGAFLASTAIGGAFAFSFLMFGPVRNWARRAFTARLEALDPTPARRVALAGVSMLTRVVPGILGGVAVIETARIVGLIADDGVGVARAAWGALVAYLIVDGFASGIFAPSAPRWRLGGFDTARARKASVVVLAIVFIVGAKNIFVAIAHAAGDAAQAARLAMGIAAVLVGGLLFFLCMPTKDRAEAGADAPERGTFWPALRFGGQILGVGIGAAAIAGHVNLADFAATRVYYLALVGAILWFARAALREAVAWGDRRLRGARRAEAPADADNFNFWIGLGVDAALLLALAPAAFLLAGFEWTAVGDLVARAFVGFRIGGVVISLTDILLSILAFVAILAGTRLVQTGLQRGPLAHSRMDAGVQNSLVTLLGYVGLVLAIAMALSIAGVDLSNLALIAGALSVGIGFGLQSIVNNFVSGLILLFERPIKVGDWIVTNSGEGIVKKISVRSTEIETFDRSSIIIPNSELVASTVTNWTHKSAVGRIKVPIGVSYDSDPAKVKEALLRCAEANPLILRHPSPFVVWVDFGASALEFELRAFVRDISQGLQARTDLRFAIFEAFRKEGIEIPFPQQDVHIRSWAAGARSVAGEAKTSARTDAPPRFEPEAPDVAED